MSSFFKKQKEEIDGFGIDNLPNEIMKSAYASYRQAAGEDNTPILDHFESFFDDEIAGYSLLTNQDKETGKYTYITVGCNLIKLFGLDVSGQTVDNVHNANLAKDAHDFYQSIQSKKKPVLTKTYWKTLKRNVGFYSLGLPFHDIFNNLTVFVVFVTPIDMEIKERKDWRDAEDVMHLQRITRFAENPYGTAPGGTGLELED